MGEDRERIEGLIREHGFGEGEARAAYFLGLAREAFGELGEQAHETANSGRHFDALEYHLRSRVLRREHPEG